MVAALVWMAGVAMAWGQDYVTGNQYKNIPFTVIEYPTGDSYGDGDNNYRKDMVAGVFDNNENTWWRSAQGGPLEVVIDFGGEIELTQISLNRGGNPNNRVQNIKVEGSNQEETFQLQDDNMWHVTVSLTNPIKTKTLTLTLERSDNNKITFNEIRFLTSIHHKPAKWYDIRKNPSMSQDDKDMDSFDDEQQWFRADMMEGTPQIQAAHTYIDTIYVHKGSKTRLVLPDVQPTTGNYTSSVLSYQRWYSYRTDKTFETTNHENDVYDLLTPRVQEGNTSAPPAYRFVNGYVGNPVVEANVPYYDKSLVEMDFYFPTDDEFETWFPNRTDIDNNWYVVACDVSCYTDYTPSYSTDSKNSTFYPSNNADGKVYEPTLSHRVLFYIAAVDGRTDNSPGWVNGFGRLKKSEYKGGGVNGKYLEEYDITFPYTRVSNKTLDLVALSKDARSYAIPDQKNGDSEVLNVQLIDDGSGITLKRQRIANNNWSNENLESYSTITGTNRGISFAYPNTRNDGTSYVNAKDSKATILVTKDVNGIVYNIARFNLTFKEEIQLLTQKQVSELEKPNSDYNDDYWYVSHRSPKYLRDNYRLLTELTWDYDESVGNIYGQSNYYPFPMKWEYSSYAFFDGSGKDGETNAGTSAGDYYGQHSKPQWGYYAIMKDYSIESATTQTPSYGKDPSTYHMYVDVSDRPGTIARLPFREKLCESSELFVSAWVKSAGTEGNDTWPSNDAAMLFTIMGVTEDSEGNPVSYTPIYRHATGQIRTTNLLSANIPGCGAGNNQWFQVYFSFTNSSETLADFDSYVLQIDNNSASTNGGDVYIDDVQVYIATPKAAVEQKAPTCGEETLLKLEVNFDPLKSRTNPGYQTHYINFCFVDSLEYVKAINQEKSVSEAIAASHRRFAYPIQGGMSQVLDYGHLTFADNFEDIQDVYEENGDNFQSGDVGETGAAPSKFFRVEGTRNMAVDIYAELEPYRKYFFVVTMAEFDENGKPILPNAGSFKENLLDPCAIVSGFSVTSQDVIKINGNVLTSDMEFCAGQVVDFSVQMEATMGETTTPITQEVFYDWIYVDEEEFERPQTIDGETVTLQNAIAQFRIEYPRATEIETEKGYYTAAMQKLLSQYYEAGELTLFQSSLSVRLPQAEDGQPYEFHVMVCPNSVLYELEGGDLALVCATPVHVSFEVTGQSPTASIGFYDVTTYPDEDIDFRSVVRIGLDEHINQIKQGSVLTIPLRKVQRVAGTSTGEISLNRENPYVYLVSSNDPVVIRKIAELNNTEEGFRKTDWPVGMMEVSDFVANPDNEENNRFSFYFDYNLAQREGLVDDSFRFREGFWYTLEVYFSQVIDVTPKTQNICDGNLSFNMKVVPEYQRWVGDENSNWNNDENWVRSFADELKNPKDYITYNDVSVRRGYVPMDFTKVTIPKPGTTESGKIKLYNNGSNKPIDHSPLTLTTTEVSEGATTNIQYDLLVKKSSGAGYECEPYYTNTVSEIHFEPNTEMLHAELLGYKKAWVDYELTKGRWYTLASPLQGVVAGDFYTDESGTEDASYFSDITFNDNRMKPAVYQRAWKGETTNVSLYTDASSSRNVAIAGNWSSVYNKVDEAYTPGTGFSLKVPGENTGKVLFRLPKDDGSYTYYNYSNGNLTAGSHKVENLPRTNAGLLESNTLKAEDITETLQAANGSSQYYLVGNPFMAHLKASAFFEKNKDVLEQKYWLVRDDNQDVAVGGKTDADWVFVGAQSTALIAPLQSFFVQKKTDANSNNQITFTKDMQVLGGTTDNLRSTDVLYLTATTQDGRQSHASISYDAAASETYESSEDAELFLDSNLGNLPMVYTAAGTMAASINRTSGLYNIPVGIYAPGAEGETVSLTFSGTDDFSYATLYDAETRTETPIREGSRFTVPANTAGRYFLRAGVPTANEAVQESAIRIYTVGGGTLVVASTDLLRTVRVYDFAGRLVANETGLRTTQCRIELPEGSYIVKAESERGEEEVKIRM